MYLLRFCWPRVPFHFGRSVLFRRSAVSHRLFTPVWLSVAFLLVAQSAQACGTKCLCQQETTYIVNCQNENPTCDNQMTLYTYGTSSNSCYVYSQITVPCCRINEASLIESAQCGGITVQNHPTQNSSLDRDRVELSTSSNKK